MTLQRRALCNHVCTISPSHFNCFAVRPCVFDRSWPASPSPRGSSTWVPLQLPDHFRFGAISSVVPEHSHEVIQHPPPRRVWEHISQTELLIVPKFPRRELAAAVVRARLGAEKTKLFVLPGSSGWDCGAASVNRPDVFSLSPCGFHWRLRFSDLIPHIHLSSLPNVSFIHPSVRISRLPHPFPPPSCLKSSHHFVLFIY